MIYAGSLDSYIDRQLYLFGQYEGDAIRLFLTTLPTSARYGVMLDIGANIGTHSLVFSRHFHHVHAFEPNPALWGQFERNLMLNGIANVSLHRIGLGDCSDVLPFFSAGDTNLGLGTFSRVDQYDQALEQRALARVEVGSEYLAACGVGNITGVKIDVQGFEAAVLRGLRAVLEQWRPIVWCEIGAGTKQEIPNLTALKLFFPYPTEVLALYEHRGVLTWRTVLQPATSALDASNYVVIPLSGQ
jgi:FkbM family methyltransferase